MAVTIRDVAEKCGLSVSTVSKALNHYSDISEETRKRVHAIAKQIGYHPNALARALKTNRSQNLGVLFVDDFGSGLTHPFFSAVLDSFKQAAEKRGYDITFINHNVGENHMTYLEHCQYRNVDGVCLSLHRLRLARGGAADALQPSRRDHRPFVFQPLQHSQRQPKRHGGAYQVCLGGGA